MIHKRDGKILVKDGKLCSSCCPEYGEDCECFDAGKTPKYYTLEFSGVTDCDCVCSWPSDINTSFILTQEASPCQWSCSENGWDVELYLLGYVGMIVLVHRTDSCPDGKKRTPFVACIGDDCAVTEGDINNDLIIDDCCDDNVTYCGIAAVHPFGYGGKVTLSY